MTLSLHFWILNTPSPLWSGSINRCHFWSAFRYDVREQNCCMLQGGRRIKFTAFLWLIGLQLEPYVGSPFVRLVCFRCLWSIDWRQILLFCDPTGMCHSPGVAFLHGGWVKKLPINFVFLLGGHRCGANRFSKEPLAIYLIVTKLDLAYE